MLYLYIFLVIVLIIRLYFVTKNNKKLKLLFMTALSDFQTQIDSLNSSFVALQGLVDTLNSDIADLTTKLGSTLTPDEASALLASLTETANKFQGLVPKV